MVLAVAHKEFMGTNWRDYVKDNGIIYDVKGCLAKNIIDARL
jgi:UDP-N-acetyl-D-galactosamine dehydrogenase